MGVVQLPLLMVREHIQRGELVRLLPDWASKPEIIHAVYPSRRGQLPSVRALLDHLAQEFEPWWKIEFHRRTFMPRPHRTRRCHVLPLRLGGHF